MNPLCVIRKLYRCLVTFKNVSGCDYIISDEATPKNIQILKCKTCGKLEVCWSFKDIEK